MRLSLKIFHMHLQADVSCIIYNDVALVHVHKTFKRALLLFYELLDG